MKPRPTHPRPCTACATGERCNFRRAQNGGFGGAICTFFVGHAASRATLAPAVKAKGRVRTAKLVRVERSGRRARLVLRGASVSEKVGIWVAFGSIWGRVRPTPLPEVLGGPTVDSAAKLASLNRAGRSRPLKWPPAVPQSSSRPASRPHKLWADPLRARRGGLGSIPRSVCALPAPRRYL